MTEALSLSLVLDIFIVILLAGTIFYTARLSFYLKNFRQNRSELKQIIADLSKQIDKAEKSIDGLHKAADEAGADLQSRMNKANSMFDELDIIVQTGDSLATRLEDLAVKNRKIIEGAQGDVATLQDVMEETASYDERVGNLIRHVDEQTASQQGEAKMEVAPVFSIRDPELEKGAKKQKTDGFTLEDNEVLSEAERDLYEALQKKSSKAQKG
jgi:ABC-type transporter Mla subunit MlaD